MLSKRKLGSFKYQISERLKELNRIGESKHEAKKSYRQACERAGIPWNPAQADGIFSIDTMQSYRQTALEFTDWLRDNHPESKDLMSIPRVQAIEYLQYRQNEGKSAWTVTKDMSALNKICNYNITKDEAALHTRRTQDIQRSRVEREHDGQYNPQNYERQITFARAFGARRESILGGAYQVRSVSIFRWEGQLRVSLIEKGGRYREAPCLRSMQAKIEQMFPDIQEREPMTKSEFKSLYESAHDQPFLFSDYTTKIDNHAFRAEYAMQLYSELVGQRGPRYVPRKKRRGYDVDILKDVSEALGHSRLDVVLDSYLRCESVQEQDEREW